MKAENKIDEMAESIVNREVRMQESQESQESMDDREEGENPSLPSDDDDGVKVAIVAQISPDLRRQLKRWAKREGYTMSGAVAYFIRSGMALRG